MALRNVALYNIWVGKKSREKLSILTEKDFNQKLEDPLGSIRQKVEHIILALLTCFSHLEVDLPYFGNTFDETIEKINSYSLEELLSCWEDLDKKVSDGLEHNLEGTVEIQRRDGISFCLKKEDFYLQYIFHTIYHRGQLNYCLKVLGKDRIDGDYLFYFDELDLIVDEDIIDYE